MEEIKDILGGESYPINADLSEEATGTLAENDDDFVFPTDLPEHPLKANEEPKQTEYKAIVITLSNEEEETKAEIQKRALTNPKLADALKNGKKTWEGFFRFWHNKTREAHKEYNYGQNPVCVKREQVWSLAEEYFTNENLRDVQAPKAKTSKPKPEKKKEDKPKKVVPLTPQMGSLFDDEDFK